MNEFIARNGLIALDNSTITGSLTVTGGITGSLLGTASYAFNADLLDGRDSSVFATTGSNQFNGNQTITGSLTVTGQITAQTLNVQQVTSSIVYSSGSNIFGSSLSDTQQFTGSVSISGSLAVGATGSGIFGRIDASNDIVAFSTSDIRFKENIVSIDKPLEKIAQIGGYTFDWKPIPELTSLHGFTGPDVGVIAQEIQKVLPEVVIERDNGFLAVKYEKIIALLIESIKELSAKVNKLENNNLN